MTDPVEEAVKADIARAEAALKSDVAKGESLWARVWPMLAALALGFVIGLIT